VIVAPDAHRGRQVDAVRCQHVDHEPVALIAVRVAVEIRDVRFEAVALERVVDRIERATRSRLAQHVDVLRHAHTLDTRLERACS
jgi:hypothetical protein